MSFSNLIRRAFGRSPVNSEPARLPALPPFDLPDASFGEHFRALMDERPNMSLADAEILMKKFEPVLNKICAEDGIFSDYEVNGVGIGAPHLENWEDQDDIPKIVIRITFDPESVDEVQADWPKDIEGVPVEYEFTTYRFLSATVSA